MRALFGSLVILFVCIVGGSYAWKHVRQVPLVAPARFPEQDSGNTATPPEAQEAQKFVTVVGPLANYMTHQSGQSLAGADSAQMETLEPIAGKPNPADHVGGSVVGSIVPVLHRTFRVRSAVQLSFAVPAHAASPHLRGTYESFVKGPGADGADADVEFLVLNERQFADFLSKHAAESTFSAEDSHSQEVNAMLPPTVNQSEKYHLIFRNNSRGPGKKFVQADFRMEF
jgi:hypothetical protein